MRDTYKKLTKVFREVFDDDSIELTPETTANDIDDWDSIEHINLIAAVEDAFGMRFQMREVSGMKTWGKWYRSSKAERKAKSSADALLFLYIHRLCADTICIRRHFMLCLVLP